MAERRMFAKTIIDSDAFLDMPLSAQALYFHLSMRADDDGFINNPKKIQRMIGASDDDCKLLLMKRFLIAFESGVVVIKHWKIHNYIQKDRYKPTIYQEEKQQLAEKDNKAYTESEQNVYIMDTQDRDRIELGESKSKDNKKAKEPKKKYGEYKNVLLTDKELQSLKSDYSNCDELITYLDEYIEMNGYKAKSHFLCIKKWVVKAVGKGDGNNVQGNNRADGSEYAEFS